jgi:c-di-GMP-binding flagellar brake protein YcgR
MWQGIDKRRFPRADFPCKIIIFKKGQQEKFSTHTENIGAGGVCVILKNALDRFSLVDLVLYIEEGKPPIKCEARVVWAVKSKDVFDIGIEFININKQDVARIERIVKECLEKEQTSSEGK